MSRDKRDSDDESKEMNYLKYSLQNLLLLKPYVAKVCHVYNLYTFQFEYIIRTIV